jgi:hypothetical protein
VPFPADEVNLSFDTSFYDSGLCVAVLLPLLSADEISCMLLPYPILDCV